MIPEANFSLVQEGRRLGSTNSLLSFLSPHVEPGSRQSKATVPQPLSACTQLQEQMSTVGSHGRKSSEKKKQTAPNEMGETRFDKMLQYVTTLHLSLSDLWNSTSIADRMSNSMAIGASRLPYDGSSPGHARSVRVPGYTPVASYDTIGARR